MKLVLAPQMGQGIMSNTVRESWGILLFNLSGNPVKDLSARKISQKNPSCLSRITLINPPLVPALSETVCFLTWEVHDICNVSIRRMLKSPWISLTFFSETLFQ